MLNVMKVDTRAFLSFNVATFWDIPPCSPYVNRRFRGTYHLHLQGSKSAEQETGVQQVALLPDHKRARTNMKPPT
jgi:hypothetical protein